MAERRGDWLQTFTGRAVYPLDPRPEDLDVRDIAHALSLQCRFSGHVSRHLSVAEHSVRVSLVVPAADALWGLLHDAAEAYLVDLPRPLKQLQGFATYREAEAAVMLAVCERFGLAPEMPASVHEADARMCLTEARDLLGPPPQPWGLVAEPYEFTITPWSARRAERAFLRRFERLHGARRAA